MVQRSLGYSPANEVLVCVTCLPFTLLVSEPRNCSCTCCPSQSRCNWTRSGMLVRIAEGFLYAAWYMHMCHCTKNTPLCLNRSCIRGKSHRRLLRGFSMVKYLPCLNKILIHLAVKIANATPSASACLAFFQFMRLCRALEKTRHTVPK